jgi:hypothetical protein
MENATLLDFLFGCHHSNLSRVFTIRRQTYRVCCAVERRSNIHSIRCSSSADFPETPRSPRCGSPEPDG